MDEKLQPPDVLRAEVLAALGERAGFTTRRPGEACPLTGVAVFGLTQVHSSRVLVIDETREPDEVRRMEADGLVTSRPGAALTIRVADCVPVLLAAPQGRAVAALHAGWRGIAGGILARGVEILCREAQVDAGQILAAAGPAIGPCCYEVDLETGRRIASRSPQGVLAEPHDEGKVMADLWQAVLGQLHAAGLSPEHTEAVRTCTRCHPGSLHSYRRDGPLTGRQIGFIATPVD
ncbi:MAG: laccase domain-containing protein [Deltaproteobacteria bacterium]|nr:laccase domain-containing protein [Deltaproteobacteria bacterium]